MPVAYGKIFLLMSDHELEGQASLGDFKNKRAGGNNFPPASPSLEINTPVATSASLTLSTLFDKSTPHPCWFVQIQLLEPSQVQLEVS